jgi:COP9 signalosome complex subunit 2
MSDDEWANTEHVNDDDDDAGWNAASNAQGQGQGDGDGGDIDADTNVGGTADAGGWGSGNDFDVDGDAVDVVDQMSTTEATGIDVEIANIFYEAEDLVRADPQQALNKFSSIIDFVDKHNKENNSSIDSLRDESKSSYFQSMLHIVILLYTLQRYDVMIERYKVLLSYIPKVTRNESGDAIDQVLNIVSNSNNPVFLNEVYSITSSTLSRMEGTERMVFNINMKLCKTYIDAEAYGDAHRVLRSLHEWCQTVDQHGNIVDDRKKGSELLEIYALEIRLSAVENNVTQMRSLYEATKDLSAAVKNPRSQSVIRECWGLMFSHDHQWQRAYAEFYSYVLYYNNSTSADFTIYYVHSYNTLHN